MSADLDVDAPTDAAASSPADLRGLVAWYRAFAERAGDPGIGERRLLTAEQLEAEAARLEEKL